MATKQRTKEAAFFWKIADEFLENRGITEGSLMGFPCLRVKGDFFATCDHRTGDLIVKLPRERVQELMDAGRGVPFAPAGKVFKEWVLVEKRDGRRWRALMDEAKAFVSG
jgi:hypothetical protein